MSYPIKKKYMYSQDRENESYSRDFNAPHYPSTSMVMPDPYSSRPFSPNDNLPELIPLNDYSQPFRTNEDVAPVEDDMEYGASCLSSQYPYNVPSYNDPSNLGSEDAPYGSPENQIYDPEDRLLKRTKTDLSPTSNDFTASDSGANGISVHDNEEPNGKKTRAQKCSLCINHGIQKDKKGHKKECSFKDCECDRCVITKNRQETMRNQQKLTRYLKKMHLQNASGDPFPDPSYGN